MKSINKVQPKKILVLSRRLPPVVRQTRRTGNDIEGNPEQLREEHMPRALACGQRCSRFRGDRWETSTIHATFTRERCQSKAR
eukprot:scaffold8179_cov430-Prasinococcus_capsulatus_cf.AAC.1